MKKSLMLAMLAFITLNAFAQSGTQAPAQIVETQYMLPKRGMEVQFEAAIKAHDAKFHPDGSYVGGLRKVDYGEKAGWYVWVMGPTTYAALDTRPGKGAHDDDWNKNVDPLIDQYGDLALFETVPDLSYGRDIFMKSDHYSIISATVKPGEDGQFRDLLGKMEKTFEAMGNRAFLVYASPLISREDNYGIVMSFTSFADYGGDWGLKPAYEKLYGAGSWQTFTKEWDDVTSDYSNELRSFVK